MFKLFPITNTNSNFNINNNSSNVLRVGEVVRAKKRHKDRWVYARLCAIARQIDEWALPVVWIGRVVPLGEGLPVIPVANISKYPIVYRRITLWVAQGAGILLYTVSNNNNNTSSITQINRGNPQGNKEQTNRRDNKL